MELSNILEVGLTHTDNYIVENNDTADFIGNKDIIMLSTPSMIKFIEKACSNLVIGKLPKNCRVVGTKINVQHINPTSVNSEIKIKVKIAAINGTKILYNIEVFNETCKIGFGTYEQCVVNLERFLDKAK